MNRTLHSILIGIFSITCGYDACSQKVVMSFATEYGSYAMGDLRDLQDEFRRELPVPSRNVRSFPSYWGFNGKLYYIVKRFQFGLTGGMNSTGARTSYSDYSGSIQYDQLAKLIHFGVGCSFRATQQNKPWEFFLSLQTEAGKTKYSLQSALVLGDETVQEEALDFKANNIIFHPSVILSRTFVQRLVISAQAGFVLDSSSELLYTKDTDLYLLGNDNEPISTNWSGFRLGISFGVKL